MKLTIIDKNNLPNFKLLLTLDEQDNKEAVIKSLNDKHVKELIERQCLVGEHGIPSVDNVDRFLTIDPKKASHAIESIVETDEGIVIECVILKNSRTEEVQELIEQGLAYFAPRMLMTSDKSKYHFTSIDLVPKPMIKESNPKVVGDKSNHRIKFIDETLPITIGVKDIVFANIWRDSFPTLCEEYGFKYIHYVNHRGIDDFFICKDDDAVNKVISSGIIDMRKQGPMTVESHYILGTLLGFPPKACAKFSKMEFAERSSITVNYCGILFRSFPDTLDDDILWLLQNKKPTMDKNFNLSIEAEKVNGYRFTTKVEFARSISDDDIIKVVKDKIITLFY